VSTRGHSDTAWPVASLFCQKGTPSIAQEYDISLYSSGLTSEMVRYLFNCLRYVGMYGIVIWISKKNRCCVHNTKNAGNIFRIVRDFDFSVLFKKKPEDPIIIRHYRIPPDKYREHWFGQF